VCYGWRVDLLLFSCGCLLKHGADGQLKSIVHTRKEVLNDFIDYFHNIQTYCVSVKRFYGKSDYHLDAF
jgi:hypothetical protein